MKDDVKISHRMMVRERMSCNDFKWYLDNIWPENFFPADDRFFGKVRRGYNTALAAAWYWWLVLTAHFSFSAHSRRPTSA